ncbi:MAG: iron-sulfur cluster assembly scaffold protein [Promethearchaeota archaeon]
MPDNFEKFVENLQREIIEKEIEDHNEKIVNLFHHPQNWGKPPSEEITVLEERKGGAKGYSLGIYLKIEENLIVKANFTTDGCGVMIATGSQTTILIEGKPVEFAENLEAQDIDKALKGLPDDERHCADLTISTLRAAIKKYNVGKSP